MKDLDCSKFTEAVLNAGRQVGVGEAELMDPDECWSILDFKSIRRVWRTGLRGISCLDVMRVGYVWFELEESGSCSIKDNIGVWVTKYFIRAIVESFIVFRNLMQI